MLHAQNSIHSGAESHFAAFGTCLHDLNVRYVALFDNHILVNAKLITHVMHSPIPFTITPISPEGGSDTTEPASYATRIPPGCEVPDEVISAFIFLRY